MSQKNQIKKEEKTLQDHNKATEKVEHKPSALEKKVEDKQKVEHKQEPKKEEAKKEQSKKEEPKRQQAKKQQSKKEQHKKEEPKHEEPKKEEPKKEEHKEKETKKQEHKAEEPKKQVEKIQIPKKIEENQKDKGFELTQISSKEQKKLQPVHEIKKQSITQAPEKHQAKETSDKLFKILQKYFKKNKWQSNQRSPHNLNLNLKYETSALENLFQFQIRVLAGQQQITKIHTQYLEKKIIVQKEDDHHLIIEVYTKKGQQIEQLIEARVKESKLSFKDFDLKTNTDQKKLYIGLTAKNGSKSSLKKIYGIFNEKGTENTCKIEFSGRFGLGNEGKTRPEDRKLIKCIAKGFQFDLKVSASPVIINRFRKNIEIENPKSSFYTLIAITKDSELKIKLKKIQDVNLLFNKLGITEVIKATPTLKQLVHEQLAELFEAEDPQHLDLSTLLTTILQTSESQKIRITKLDSKILLSVSLHQTKNIKDIIKK